MSAAMSFLRRLAPAGLIAIAGLTAHPSFRFLAPAGLAAQSPDQANDPDAIKTTLVAMWSAIERGDVDAYASYLHPDFTQFGEFDPYFASGKELEVRNMRRYLNRARGVHTDMHQPEVTVRGDVAWITYYWTDSGEVDGKVVTSRGKSTRIFVKERGRWLCIHGHYTALP